MPNESLQSLYEHELKDLYSAEKQILEALPKMISAAGHESLKAALTEHQTITEKQVERLDRIFQGLGKRPENEKCKGMEGLLKEGDKALEEFKDSDVLDAAIIAAAQRVEHYEMAGYGCASDPTGSGDSDYLILGDFNAYTMEDPIRTLVRGSDGRFDTEDDLVRLFPKDSVASLWGDYTYRFDGMVGPLDHAFATRGLLQQLIGMAPWHINSDESAILDYRTAIRHTVLKDIWTATPARSSDHDPIIVALLLANDSVTTDVRDRRSTPSSLDLTHETVDESESEGSPVRAAEGKESYVLSR